MEESYSVLAPIYDALMADVDYAGYVEFFEKSTAEFSPDAPKRVIDLGCGTGSVAVLLAQNGFEVCGIDISCDMLSAAQKKASERGARVLFAEQDMCALSLGGGWGAAICALDGMNYLPDADALCKCFSAVAGELCDGGLFVFDMNTKYKYENVIGGNSFVYELKDKMLIWQNYYKKRAGVCDFYLTLFEKDGKRWRRSDEYQCQKMFTEKTVVKLLSDAGFELIRTCSDFGGSPVTEKSERIFYICRKKRIV